MESGDTDAERKIPCVDLVAFDVKNRKGALSMKKVILFSFDNVNGFF